MFNKILVTAFGLASMLFAFESLAQSKATITIKKNLNGVVTEETQSITLEEGRNIQDVLSEMGVLDEFGNLKEGQQFEIKIDKFSTDDNSNMQLSIAPDLNQFSKTYSNPVMEQRPFLGVMVKENNGQLLVTDVEPGSAAAKAGILKGDHIVQIEGEKLTASTDMVRAIQTKQIGDKLKITVSRDGKSKNLKAILGQKLMEVRHPLDKSGEQLPLSNNDLPIYNFRFGPDSITILTPRKDSVKICQPFAWNNGEMAVKETPYLGVTPFESLENTTSIGVQVKVEPETSAEKMGLLTGDIIINYNGVEVNSFDQLAEAVSNTQAGDQIKLTVLRDGKEKQIEGAIGKRSCSHMDDFRIFHDFKGMDEGGNYFYDYEFDMDVKDLERHMEQLIQDLDKEQSMLDRERQTLEQELGRIRSNESMLISIRIDEISAEEKAAINKNAKTKIAAENDLAFESISFFPNPSNGLLNLSFNTAASSPVKVIVFDSTVNTVFMEERSMMDGAYSNLIDIASQPSGSYYLQIIQGSKSYSKKIIKNN